MLRGEKIKACETCQPDAFICHGGHTLQLKTPYMQQVMNTFV